MKDFEKFLKSEGIENAMNMPTDAFQALLSDKEILIKMGMTIKITGFPFVMFDCIDKETGFKKKYYLTTEMLRDFMELSLKRNSSAWFSDENY